MKQWLVSESESHWVARSVFDGEMGLSKGAVSKMATKLAELGRLKTNGRQYALP
jgi:hypothetical protein